MTRNHRSSCSSMKKNGVLCDIHLIQADSSSLQGKKCRADGVEHAPARAKSLQPISGAELDKCLQFLSTRSLQCVDAVKPTHFKERLLSIMMKI